MDDETKRLIFAIVNLGIGAISAIQSLRKNGPLRLAYLAIATSFAGNGVLGIIAHQDTPFSHSHWFLALRALCLAGELLGFVALYLIKREKKQNATF